MISQWDHDGNKYLLLDSIIWNRKYNSAIKRGDKHLKLKCKPQQKKTTKGWNIYVLWKGGRTTWEQLSEIKESNPADLSEYTKSTRINEEQCFPW